MNDAGILVRGLAEDLSPAAFREVLDVNLTGAFLCARAVIPGMKARRRGRIVNVDLDLRARSGPPEASAYNASKWGLVGLTKCLAEELRPARRRLRGRLAGERRHRDADARRPSRRS